MVNPILSEIAMRGGAALARRALGKRLARNRTPQQVAEILEGRGLGKAVTVAALTRLGIPPVLRALLVGSVLLANSLVQRRKRKAKTGSETEET